MSNCCHSQQPNTSTHCHSPQKSIDYLLCSTFFIILASYLAHLLFSQALSPFHFLHHFTQAIFEQANTVWFGIVLAMIFVGLLEQTPKDFIMALLGKGGTHQGILRATLAGVFFDLCSHGILMVAGKLYARGASLGQIMAFLIASPWNSLSLTLILFTLIGVSWTFVFIAGSLFVAVISGLMFDYAVKLQVLPANPNLYHNAEFRFFHELRSQLQQAQFNSTLLKKVMRDAWHGSTMILRWLFLGLILAGLSRALIPTEVFATYFGATLLGLFSTLAAATLIEVCSEGSVPIAADIFTRAHAPGNAFTFLMAGVSTDYTEILVLKQITGSWKIAFFLPLVTLPQITLLGWLLNHA